MNNKNQLTDIGTDYLNMLHFLDLICTKMRYEYRHIVNKMCLQDFIREVLKKCVGEKTVHHTIQTIVIQIPGKQLIC